MLALLWNTSSGPIRGFWYFIVYFLKTTSTYHSVKTISLNNKCRHGVRVKRNKEFQKSKEMMCKRSIYSTVTISSKWHIFMALCILIHWHNYVGNSQNSGKVLERDKTSILDVGCICCCCTWWQSCWQLTPTSIAIFPPIYWVDLSFSFWFVEKSLVHAREVLAPKQSSRITSQTGFQ